MDNSTVLFVTILLTAVLGASLQIVLYRHRKKQKAEFPLLCEQFELSLKTNTYQEIIEFGNRVVYNKFVPTKHLEIIQKVAEELESKDS